MVKVFIMRYNKGRIPPANLTEEMKRDITKKVGDFLKENPDSERSLQVKYKVKVLEEMSVSKK